MFGGIGSTKLLFAFLLPVGGSPAFLHLLAAAADDHGVHGDVLGHGGGGGNKGPVADLHRGNEVGVAAHKYVAADGGAVLVEAVIVAGDSAAAEVAVVAYIAVAHIGEMGHLGSLAQVAVFQLDKGADLGALPHHAVGPDVGVGADLAALLNLALLTLGGVDGAAVSHLAVGEHDVGANLAVGAHSGLAPKNGAGQQQSSRLDGDLFLHIHAGRVHHHYAGLEQLFPLCL